MNAPATAPTDNWLLLTGGVGGAKLALGLDRILPPGALTVIVNTGDDFSHLGLAVSPDLDTLMYTLGGVVNADTGWGRRDDTWSFMAALEELGGETWFRLGDRDLATHVERTRRLAAGESLSAITADFCRRLGIGSRILPMSDSTVATRVATSAGELSFQDYFVRRRAEPVVTAIEYAGAADAAPPAAALRALADPRLRGILIAPSNPWLSIGPILAVPALREALGATAVPVVAVSPLVGGRALKGPTAKLMIELGLAATSATIAQHYREILDGLILDLVDAGDTAAVEEQGVTAAVTSTVMQSLYDRQQLARFALDFAARLNGDRT
jgi:LPPG:FO 2-phospho-L-lactate transferase